MLIPKCINCIIVIKKNNECGSYQNFTNSDTKKSLMLNNTFLITDISPREGILVSCKIVIIYLSFILKKQKQ